MPPVPFGERNGWNLYAHPAFGDPLNKLTDTVEQLKREHPERYSNHPKTKLLKRILEIILDEVPRDPNATEFQLGNTLGLQHRHWRRAKFLGRFRLFFRFSTAHKSIVYAWVNDESTLRKAGAQSDPYVIFGRRLRDGSPPDGWDELLRGAAKVRFAKGRRTPHEFARPYLVPLDSGG